MITIVGQLADPLGAASQFVTVPANHPGRNFDVKREFMAFPATEYRSVRGAAIDVDVEHRDDQVIGRVAYLELTGSDKLFASPRSTRSPRSPGSSGRCPATLCTSTGSRVRSRNGRPSTTACASVTSRS